MKSTTTVPFGLVLLLLVLFPPAAGGQQAPRESSGRDHLISGSPLLLVAGGFNAEYERRVEGAMTLGIAGGWLDLDDEDQMGVSGILRFYPQRTAFAGFYFGGRGGFYHVDEGRKSHTALGIGMDMGYGWLLGPGHSFYVGLGIGAVRLIARDLGRASKVLPQIRLLDIGVAF